MHSYRSDFPLLAARPDLIYLDSAATAQKPASVIEAVDRFYRNSCGPVHRGLYALSQESSRLFEEARSRVAGFIEAAAPQEIIFTRSATESLNLLATCLENQVGAGEQILLSEAEHHANLLPWQALAERRKAELVFIPVDEAGEIDLVFLEKAIGPKTRVVSLTHCSNVLGTITPLAAVREMLARRGSDAFLIADASQSAPHLPLSVSRLGVDFLVFSGHKLYGPSGIGILWGREALLEALPPYQRGGDMVVSATYQEATWNSLPWRLEAGTPNSEGAVGLAAALDYLEAIGMAQVAEHTAALSGLLRTELEKLDGIRIIGNPDPRSGIISFTAPDIHPHDLAGYLSDREICIRAGQQCASPLHGKLGLAASNRASIGIYTETQDIARFAAALKEIIERFAHV